MAESALHGWLAIDKPLGMSSAHVVTILRRHLNIQRIGHGGTLDPMASGILPIAVGEATKTVAYTQDATKTYRFTIRWGEERDTDDAQGNLIMESPSRPSQTDIEGLLPAFTGNIEQLPPQFSALKVKGKRAYALARQGKVAELKPRPVEIQTLKLLHCPDKQHAELEMTCGKGTYVRSIARDLGRKLGCLGHISVLRRTRVGKLDEKGAISLDNLESLGHTPPPLWPVESALDDILALYADSSFAAAVRMGRAVYLHLAPDTPEPTAAYLSHDDKVVALGTLEGKTFKPVRVFNY